MCAVIPASLIIKTLGLVGGAMAGARAVVAAPVDIDVVDPHCVPVTPAHDAQVFTLPNGHIMLTVITHQFDTDGQLMGVVTARMEWTEERLREVRQKVGAVLEGGLLATMTPANVMAG